MKYALLTSLLTVSMISVAKDETPRYRNRHFMEKVARYFRCRQERFEFENHPDIDGNVPLHEHVREKDIKSIQDSLDNGAPINYKNHKNLSPLNALEILPIVPTKNESYADYLSKYLRKEQIEKNLNLFVEREADNILLVLLELLNNGAYVDHMQEVEGKKPVDLQRGEEPLFDRVQKEKTKWCKKDPKGTVCTYCTKMNDILRERIKTQPQHLYEEYAQYQTE